MSISEKAKEFDKSGKYRRKIDNALELLKQFRRKYPFKDHPEFIDDLTVEDLFKEGEDYFFKWIMYKLKPLGYIGGYPTVFRNACEKLEVFKDLLRTVVDEEKTLAEKVDAPWENISGMGGDRHLAKKIICCYHDDVLPIFKTADLEYFFELLSRQNLPSNYDSMSKGEKFQFLNQSLLNVRESCVETKNWDNVYFMWFLYVTYKGLS